MGLERYRFTPRRGVAIDRYNVDKVSAELGLEGESLRVIKGSRVVYFYDYATGGLYPVERRLNGYKALVAPGPRIPYTLEINGIHMHRIVGIDPISDARLKIASARVRRGHVVLDTCMGLGYTVAASLERGASRVVTVELDPDVLWVSEHNPYSSGLASDNVEIILGNAVDVVERLPDESFDRIIHDPPRLSKTTGSLYGLSLYRELYRLLKPGGVLFHYTGSPGRKRSLSIPGRTASRLREAGFDKVKWVERAQGLVAVKPRY